MRFFIFLLFFMGLSHSTLAQGATDTPLTACSKSARKFSLLKEKSKTPSKMSKTLFQKKESEHFLKALSLLFFGRPFPSYFSKKGIKGKRQAVAYNILVPALKMLSPFPLEFYQKKHLNILLREDYFLRGPLGNIFETLWHNPQMRPSFDEIKLLTEYKQLNHFYKTKDFLNSHKTFYRFGQTLHHFKYWAKILSFIAVVNYMTEIKKENKLSSQEFLEIDSKNPYDIQLLIDTVPFPHIMLRMGPYIYNYGVSHLTRKNVATAFNMDTYNDMVLDWHRKKTENTSHQTPLEKNFPDRSAQSFSQATGLEDLDKTITVVTLHLSKNEYRALKEDFEKLRSVRYLNITLVNDCATMLVRALRKHTSFKFNTLIDQFPGALGTALAAMKSGGDPRIGEFYQVSMNNKSSEKGQFGLSIRNAWIHALELKLLIEWFSINQFSRAFVELYTHNKGLTRYDPQVSSMMEKGWKDELQSIYDDNPKILSLRSFIGVFTKSYPHITGLSSKTEKEEFLNDYQVLLTIIEDAFLELKKKSPTNLAGDKFINIRNTYRQEILERKKTLLLEQVKTFKKGLLNAPL